MTSSLAASPAARWCLTLTGHDGTPLAHGCATRAPGQPGGGWELALTIKPLTAGPCTHTTQSPAYRPPPRMRHLVTIRNPTCTAPGCRNPATRGDLDHTIPHDTGGPTCPCNLGPLCRRHHRAKQAQGWHLEQTSPGTFTWHLPHGRTYHTGPGHYPEEDPAP